MNATDSTTSTLLLEQDLHFGVGKFVTATDTANATDLVDFNGYKISFGGDETTTTSIANSQSWANANVSLSGPAALTGSKTVTLTSAGYINGNGNRFTFGASSVLDNGGFAVTFDDIILSNLTSASLAGSGDWTFIQSRLEGNSRALEIDGSITSATVNVFEGNTTFGASTIRLMTDVTPGGTWTINGVLIINGCGHVFNCDGSGKKIDLAAGTLSLVDITLAEVVAASFDADAAATLHLSNVNWLGASGGSIRVIGMNQVAATQGAATLALASSETAGNIFATDIDWQRGVNLELLSDTTITSTWTFSDDSVIDGQGRHLNLTSGVLKILAGKTLTLRNVVLDDVVTASLFDDTGYTGTLNLSNVTIILNGADVTWSGTVAVYGPLTVITGSNVFTGSDMTLNGVTAYYDTLSATDGNNLVVSTPSTGRVMFINPSVPVTTGTIIIAADADVARNIYLYPTDGAIAGHVISCTNDAIYDGHGRSIVFPYTDGTFSDSKVVLSVAATKKLTTTKMVLEGLVPSQHLAIDGKLFFGDDTTIRLHQDIALTETLTFGSTGTADSETMVLDLGGHTIDMTHASAAIVLQGQTGDGTANTLRIKNGRIINLSGTKLSAEEATLVVLENVELSLSSDTTWADAALSLEGNCVLSGLAGSLFINTSTDNLTIAARSHLTILDGMIYSHNNSGTDNFVMADASSKLELIGATFRHPDAAAATLALSVGTLILDHKSYLQPGNDNMTIASSLTLEVRPGATLNVTAGTGASAGTVTFN